MKDRPKFIPRFLRPYLIIGGSGILAFAPVIFMLRSLKNDLVALEYPINHFMSQCIRNGEIPYWFNTWGMGFPLQSNLTWGIFSTPQMLFCSIFNYDISALHIEFVFFVLLAGWSMFYLLKKHFLQDERMATVLACCYMLSGFIAGSGQWMLYVTAVAFIPLVVHALLQLLKTPSFRHALIFAAIYFISFTSLYAGLNIITTYGLLIFTASYLLFIIPGRAQRLRILKFLALAGLMIIILCLPCLLATMELLNHMSRGNPISGDPQFFNSNYVPFSGLQTFLIPFSSVKMNYAATEGTMIDSYMGLFSILLLPLAIALAFREKNRVAIVLFFAGLLFLLISMGPVLPLRNALNILPGFSYFRNAGIFRSYAIFFIVLFLAYSLRNRKWEEIFNWSQQYYSRILKIVIPILLLCCLAVLIANFNAMRTASFSSAGTFIRELSAGQAFFISAIVQMILLIKIYYSYRKNLFRLLKVFFIADLVVNVLLCSPYFIVSSYTPAQVNSILYSEKGFPLQKEAVGLAAATFVDEHNNVWNNTNIFSKQVSLQETYRGPLTLNNFPERLSYTGSAYSILKRPIAFIKSDTSNSSINILLQRPTHVRLEVNLDHPDSLTLLQNYFPGWNAFYNQQKLEMVSCCNPGMTVGLPAGKGIIDFRYERKDIWIPALFLHFFVLGFLGWQLVIAIRKTKVRVL